MKGDGRPLRYWIGSRSAALQQTRISRCHRQVRLPISQIEIENSADGTYDCMGSSQTISSASTYINGYILCTYRTQYPRFLLCYNQMVLTTMIPASFSQKLILASCSRLRAIPRVVLPRGARAPPRRSAASPLRLRQLRAKTLC